ncbi:MAG: Maf family protein [Candidatus Micrarchaeia archaeon]
MDIILASGSPRRERLLRKIAHTFSVLPAKTRERLLPGEPFPRACARLAREKARAVAKKRPGAVVIGADTIAYLGKMNCRKTSSRRAARAILLALSGKTHRVVTGVAVIFPGKKAQAYSVRAEVRMKRLTPKMLDWYMETGEWKGRAGSYDVSGKGARLVERINGEKETVVGLPLKRLALILK